VTRRPIWRWLGWFIAANAGLCFLVGLRYLLIYDWPASAAGIVYPPLAMLGNFALVTAFFMLLACVPLLVIGPLRRSVMTFAVIVASLMLALLVLDTNVYAERRIHLSMLVAVLFEPSTWMAAALVLTVALLFEAVFAGVLRRWLAARPRRGGRAITIAPRGYDLSFSLPQDRGLVRDPQRWRGVLDELAARFTPFGRNFQVGQAVNRSKWGIWRYDEYETLLAEADAAFAAYPRVRLLGPAVIDFELYATAALLNMRWRTGLRLDGVASLLYVDRRGAPENTQLGLDTVGKVTLLKAIADTARNSTPGSWITEVNWPLWEGPHSPAGRTVSVDEETQADYLVRYYLLALCSGLVERVYWWQLVARGYGLVAPQEGGSLRRRPAFDALACLARSLRGATFTGALPAPRDGRLYDFLAADGHRVVVGWSTTPGVRAELPAEPEAAWGRNGAELATPGPTVELTGSPSYYRLQEP
jgi:hypothetical protein